MSRRQHARLVRRHTAAHRHDDDPATDADQPREKAGAQPGDATQRYQSHHGEFLSRLMFYSGDSYSRLRDRNVTQLTLR
jgi:hypothetical protein